MNHRKKRLYKVAQGITTSRRDLHARQVFAHTYVCMQLYVYLFIHMYIYVYTGVSENSPHIVPHKDPVIPSYSYIYIFVYIYICRLGTSGY